MGGIWDDKEVHAQPVRGLSIFLALPIFHAYTGYDTVSSFHVRGKKTAWDTWKILEEVTFLALYSGPAEVTNDHMAMLERFTILLYNHTSSKINMAVDVIPLTRAALM